MNKLNNILMIDDDATTNRLLELILEDLGVAKQVHFAKNGEQALNLLSAGQCIPELIFLDINMPIMNGFQFLDQYREFPKERRENQVIIMLTTSLFEEDRKKAEAYSEVSEFMSKPITFQSIIRLLEKYFSQIKMLSLD